MDVQKLVMAEIGIINRILEAHRVQAGTSLKRTRVIRSGFISYGLAMADSERMSRIESVTRELSNRLTEKRQRLLGSRDRVPARLSDFPPAIEVPHPSPEPLLWSWRKIDTAPPHSMLIGRSYIHGPRCESVAFDDAPHALVVGITGAGKSVLQQMMLLSLCYATSPADLRIVLVDLKNEDMVPFARLPHVERFAGTPSEAIAAIRSVRDEKDRRVADPTRKPYRLVLWIDELAQLAQEKEAREALGDIASIGRGKLINLVAATQYPTAEGGMGPLMKANFPIRLVGMVAPGQSHIATGRAQAGADLLPGKGSFLRCQGPDVYRFQAYYIDPADVVAMAGYVGRQWVATQPAIAGYSHQNQPATSVESDAQPIAGYDSHFPIRAGRPLTETEAQAVRRMAEAGEFDYRGQFSERRAMMAVYGSRDPDRAAWIREALDQVAIGD